MRFIFLHALALLAALPAPAAWEIKPGTVSLALSPDSGSSLGLDFSRFVGAVCPGSSQLKGPTGRINCGSSIDGTRSFPIVATLNPQGHLAELVHASLQVTQLKLVSREPWSAPCGDFDFTVTLDPQVAQPASKLILAPEGGEPQGVFSGLLDLALSLRFQAVGDGRIVKVPARIQVPVGGPYMLADPPEEPGGAAWSNVVLLARRNDCFLSKVEFCASWARCCPAFCLTAPQEHIERRGAP